MSDALIPSSKGGDYKMIESLHIENFRCFENIELQNLKRINVVVGNNGSGKTSLFEAIFLAGIGHPTIALRLRTWRGLGQPEISLERTAFETLWKDMFFGLDQKRTVSISLAGSAENTRSVTVQFSPSVEEVTIPVGKGAADPSMIIPIVFEYITGTGEKHTYPVQLVGGEISIKGAAQTMPCAYFTTAVRPSPTEAAARFSKLAIQNDEERVFKTMKLIYPDLRGISVQTFGGVSLLYANVKGLREKIPLSLYSDGAYIMASILLGIADTENGVVLVDEVESRFYYDRLPEIWQAMYKFCREFKVQLFASTHSLENLMAAAEIADGKEKEFELLRTVREGNKSVVRQVSGKNFRDAIDAQLELR
jgi:AAA15 family ATPase/GTPase